MVAMVVSCQDDTCFNIGIEVTESWPAAVATEPGSVQQGECTTCNLTQLSHYPYENLHKKDNNNNERYVIWI